MTKPIKIDFVGYHESFSRRWNHIVHLLRDHFPIVLADDPDFLFFSDYKAPHRQPRYDNCIKIYTTEENFRAPWQDCDYALTSDHLDDSRHLRLPLYVRYLLHQGHKTGDSIIKHPFALEKALYRTPNKRFCNFVYSNGNAQHRIRFFDVLSKYKPVDAGGRVRNNMGTLVGDKLTFLRDYKFTIAFENAAHPGYITEKLVEPMLAYSLPIYWGDPRVGEDFNPASFVNANIMSIDEAVEAVILLDRHEDLYAQALGEPWLHGNTLNRYLDPGYLVPFFTRVFADESRGAERKSRAAIQRMLSLSEAELRRLSWPERNRVRALQETLQTSKGNGR